MPFFCIIICQSLRIPQFSSVAQSCPTLCAPMNGSTPGLPVHHQLPEFTQTHVHWVSDAIQPSHPLSSPSPPAFSLSQHQGLFKWVSSSHQVAKVLELSKEVLVPHSSTLAWKIPWMEEPEKLQSMGSLRFRHDWATSLSLFTFTHWRRKWQPTPVFLPGESQGRGIRVGCRLRGLTESDTTEVTQQQQDNLINHFDPVIYFYELKLWYNIVLTKRKFNKQ